MKALFAGAAAGAFLLLPASALAVPTTFYGEDSSPVLGFPISNIPNAQAAEAALSADFSAEALAYLTVEADGMIADLHGSPAYRAHLVKVMTERAVRAAA